MCIVILLQLHAAVLKLVTVSGAITSMHYRLLLTIVVCCCIEITLQIEGNNKRVPTNLRAEGGTRRGNMGHLTRISNMVVQNLEKGPVQAQITDLIKGNHIFH